MIRTWRKRAPTRGAAAAILLALAAQCSPSPVPVAASRPVALAPSGPADAGTPPPAPDAAPGEPHRCSPIASSRHLCRFHAALAALEGKQRRRVRVAFVGDSHTQADWWVHAVRRMVQDRFGDGGPGFVHLGWNLAWYRHAGVRFGKTEGFRVEPKPISSSRREGDGVYGLGGLRFAAERPGAYASVEAPGPGAREWDLAYRLAPGAALLVEAAGVARQRVEATAAQASGQVLHRTFATEAADPALRVEATSEGAELFGVAVESASPGVVVDTLGIGGARAATALAWDETAWAGELARREYDLVIVAYGTNDSAVGSRAALEAFPRHLAALLGRIRKGAPGADCVLFGPIDRAAKKKDPSAKAGRKGAAAQFETAPEVQVLDASERAEAERLGCAFFSGLEAMGGAGSMIEWVRASPPLGHRDHVHLTREGYLVVGERLAKFLMDGY